MKILTKKNQEELTELIVKETGCSSFFLILSEAQYPCPDELAGDGCKGHSSQALKLNIKKEYLGGLLQEALDNAPE